MNGSDVVIEFVGMGIVLGRSEEIEEGTFHVFDGDTVPRKEREQEEAAGDEWGALREEG
jgi:hypothetical protein